MNTEREWTATTGIAVNDTSFSYVTGWVSATQAMFFGNKQENMKHLYRRRNLSWIVAVRLARYNPLSDRCLRRAKQLHSAQIAVNLRFGLSLPFREYLGG